MSTKDNLKSNILLRWKIIQLFMINLFIIIEFIEFDILVQLFQDCFENMRRILFK